jgi:spore coat protein U-like protein
MYRRRFPFEDLAMVFKFIGRISFFAQQGRAIMVRAFFSYIAASSIALAIGTIASPASAAITGTVNATITLTNGCIINGGNTNDGGTANLGTVNFGSNTTLFTQSDATLASSAGGSVTVQCSVGVAPTLTFHAGQNDANAATAGAGNHAMADGAGHFVSYNLYLDASRTTPIAIGGAGPTLPTDGSQATIPLYGRAFGNTGLTAGIYNDVVTVTLDL